MSTDLQTLEAEAPAAPAGRNFLQVAWQRKSLVLLGLVIGLILGTFYYAQKTPVYRSGTQVLVAKKGPSTMQVVGGDPRMGFMEDYINTHMVLIRSHLLVSRAVKKRDLKSLKSFAGMGDPTGAVIAGLTAIRDTKETGGVTMENIINLSYKGPVADECGTVINAIIDTYKEFLGEMYRNFSDDTVKLITDARDVLQNDLAKAEKDYADFRQTAPLVVWKGKDGNSLYMDRLQGIEAKRSALLMRQAELQGRLNFMEAAIKEGKGRAALVALTASTSAPTTMQVSPERALEEQLLPLLLQEQALLEDLGPGHPQVRAVRKRIQLLREYAEQMVSSRAGPDQPKGPDGKPLPKDPVQAFINATRQELIDAQLGEKALAALAEGQQKEARDLATYEDKDNALRKKMMGLDQVLQKTIDHLTLNNLNREAGGYEVRVLTPAGIGAKVAPLAYQVLIGGALVGLLIGCGLAYLADVTDKSFRNPEEIRQRLGLPVVGHIPPLVFAEEPVSVNGETNGQALSPTVSVYHRPRSMEAEAFRAVRTALYFSTQGEGPRVVQITSPNMGDGKTTLAANVAVSIAQSGKQVILLDADFRRPRIHKLFAVPAEIGLASVLTGTTGLEGAIRSTAIAGLSVLPCGPCPHNPAELLSLPRFPELLDLLRERYDFVLIDTPPLLAVTDPCVVAARVDGVLLALRVVKNGRPQAERAKEILATLGARILGVVVIGAGADAGPTGYEYYRYDQPYGYEYVQENGEVEKVTRQ